MSCKTGAGVAVFAALCFIIATGAKSVVAEPEIENHRRFCEKVKNQEPLPRVKTKTPLQLAPGESARVTGFDTRAVRFDTGIEIENGGTYRFKIIEIPYWCDKSIPARKDGFVDGKDAEPLLFTTTEWLRRDPEGIWFELLGQIAESETLIHIGTGKDARMTANRPGRLYLFVNDVEVPFLTWYFYDNNHGTADIVVTRD